MGTNAAAFSCMPLLWGGVFDGHDMLFHLNRIEGIDVPIVRGKLTTIRDEFLTRDYAPGIGIDPGFDGDINITIPD